MNRLSGPVLVLMGLLSTYASPAHAQLFGFRRRSTVIVTPAVATTAPTTAPSTQEPVVAPATGEPILAPAPGHIEPVPVVNPMATAVATPTATTVTPPPALSSQSVETAALQMPTVVIDHDATSRSAGATGPAVHLVNSKALLLEFELKGVGPSGVGGVDLWYTRNGQIWHKYTGLVPNQSPIPVEMDEDGLYGFTVIAKSGVGLGRSAPQPGEPPQIWVEVDTTRPEVKLAGTQAGVDESGRTLTLRWTATDKNLVGRPITLSYSDHASGPWVPFATNVENTGLYIWRMSPGLPNSVLVRVEATDRVGNVGEDKSAMPAPIDLSRPQAALIRASRNGVMTQPVRPGQPTQTTQPVQQTTPAAPAPLPVFPQTSGR